MGCRIVGDSGPGRNGRCPGEADLAIEGNLAHEAIGTHPSSQRGGGHQFRGRGRGGDGHFMPSGGRSPDPDYIELWGDGSGTLARTKRWTGSVTS